MTTRPTTETRTAARRPRDRKAPIIAAATARFDGSGFHGVAMDEIAADVGITAGALYRHFPSKHELLAQVVLANLDAFERAMDDAGPTDVAGLCRSMIRHVLDHRREGLLLQLEARNLPPERHAEVRARLRGLGARAVAVVLGSRPELSPADADLLVWALLAVVTSPAHHRATLRRRDLESVLFSACERVWQTAAVPATKPDPTPHPVPKPALAPVARRETVLAAAVRLFHQHG